MEEIRYAFESKKDIEALKLEAKQARYGCKIVIWIYILAIAFCGVMAFWEPISDWLSDHLGSKSKDYED